MPDMTSATPRPWTFNADACTADGSRDKICLKGFSLAMGGHDEADANTADRTDDERRPMLDGVITDFVKPAAPDIDLSIFNRAAEEIDRRGHAKWALQDHRGGVCLYGAYNVVDHGYADYLSLDAFSPGENAFAKGLGFPSPAAAADWNNADERTPAEVVDRLRRAARGEFV